MEPDRLGYCADQNLSANRDAGRFASEIGVPDLSRGIHLWRFVCPSYSAVIRDIPACRRPGLPAACLRGVGRQARQAGAGRRVIRGKNGSGVWFSREGRKEPRRAELNRRLRRSRRGRRCKKRSQSIRLIGIRVSLAWYLRSSELSVVKKVGWNGFPISGFRSQVSRFSFQRFFSFPDPFINHGLHRFLRCRHQAAPPLPLRPSVRWLGLPASGLSFQVSGFSFCCLPICVICVIRS